MARATTYIGPPITSVGAQGFVGDRFSLAGTWGTESFDLAREMIDNLSGFEIESLGITPANIAGNYSIQVSAPDAPDIPDDSDFTINDQLPSRPSIQLPTIPSAGTAPTFSRNAPNLQFGGRPQRFTQSAPNFKGSLINIQGLIPSRPNISFPQLPALDDIAPPPKPDVIRNFEFDESLRPVKDIDLPDLGWMQDYEIPEYSSGLLDEVRTEVSRMLKSGTGLPPAIEQMIFDRSRGREDAVSEQALMESLDDWASKGFSMPSGILDAKRERIRQESQNRASTLNRELTVYVHEKEIENLRFAIQQGVALESILIQLHTAQEQLKLQLATSIMEAMMNRFRAEVELYNADVNAFRIEAEIFRERIRAEMSKVELFRAELEAERLKGELNQQKVQLYRAELEGVEALVNVYATEMQGAEVASRVNDGLLRNYGLELQAYTSQIQANAEQFRAYAVEVEAETSKVRGYEAEVRAFSARTQAYAAGVEAQNIRPRLEIEKVRTEADVYRAEVSGFQAKVAAEQARVQGVLAAYQAKAGIFSSHAQIYSADIGAQAAQLRLNFENARADAELNLKAEDMKLNEGLQQSAQLLEAMRGASQAASQLAASSFSAVNASASVSESASAGNSWGNSYQRSQSTSAAGELSGSVTF